uniref:HEPN domain-containing protein n=1 Tax=Archaeoglobus fulgidus TaxID=2234 RepID=A0A7C2SFD9_ARCFL
MDEKAKAILMLGLLNDAYADTRNMIYYLQDFLMSHPEWSGDLEKYGIKEVLELARELERIILESMDKLKRVVES